MKQIDLSIIILNFNTRELTAACLRSIEKANKGSYGVETILCDNASVDGTDEMVKKEFPKVVFIQNGANIGFAAGNNPGIRRAKGRYILLLNSDTEVGKDTVTTMIRFMDEHPKAGVSTSKLVLADGSIDPASHRGFPTPWAAFSYMLKLERLFPKSRLFGRYHMGYLDMQKPHQIDCPSGAFFLVRKEVIAAVGVLDEDFFMYGEDVDWAYRIKRAGWQVWFVPQTTVLHRKKQSGRAHADRLRRIRTQTYFISTMKLFYKKHYAEVYGFFISALVYFVLDIRLFLLQKLGL